MPALRRADLSLLRPIAPFVKASVQTCLDVVCVSMWQARIHLLHSGYRDMTGAYVLTERILQLF